MLLNLNITEKNILILGGERASAKIIEECVKGNAYVTIVAPKSALPSVLKEKISDGEIAWFNRNYQARDFDGKSIVFNFTGDSAIANICKNRGILYYDASESSDISVATTYSSS
jgi:siroheme synthase (precorrin-2 oxidase/ferrochelatase)